VLIGRSKITRLTEKLTKLKEEMGKLAVHEKQMLASPDQQISLTDPDSRSMATSGRGSGIVGYNVQVAVDTEHHLIVTHEVTNSGSDRAQLANMAKEAKAVLKTETLEAVADRGYFSSLEILACHEAGITVTLPKPQTSGAKSDGRFGKQDFVYLPEEHAYRCPAGEQLPYRFTSEEDGERLRRYSTTACKIVRSNRSARQGQSGGFRDGSMSICSRLCSSASTRTHEPCASVARRSSIRSAP
jgi:Transposase DDE domain